MFIVCSFGCFASVAGEFYPAEKDQLSRDIDSYLKDFKVIKQEGDLLAIIVPTPATSSRAGLRERLSNS